MGIELGHQTDDGWEASEEENPQVYTKRMRKRRGVVHEADTSKRGEFTQVQLYLSDYNERIVNAYCRRKDMTVSEFFDIVAERAVANAKQFVTTYSETGRRR